MIKNSIIPSIVKNFLNKIQSSVKYKLSLTYFIAISIPILVFSIISYQMSSNSVEKDYRKYKMRINNQISHNIDENIQNLFLLSSSTYLMLEDMLYILDTPPQYDQKYFDNNATLNSYFLSVMQGSDSINSIALIDKEGNIKYSADRQMTPLNLLPMQNEQWFKDTVKLKGSPLVREPHYIEYYDKNAVLINKKVISICRSIKRISENDEYHGILIFDEDVNVFWKKVASVDMDPGEIITIFGGSGDVVYTNCELSGEAYLQIKKIINTPNNDDTRFKLGEQNMLVTYGESPVLGWKVVSMLPVTELQKKSDFLKNINISLFFVLIVFTLIISSIISYIITLPINRLMNSFTKLQDGDFNTVVAVKGKDELSKIGITFNNMVFSIKTLIQQKYEMNLLRKQAELDSLQSQINPHFLFNTLTSLKSVIDNGESNKSSLMVQNLSDIFRYNLSRGKYEVKFFEELDLVKKYLFIQECRFEGRYHVVYDIDEEVLSFNILRLTLQPIVENSLYHGLDARHNNGELHITAKRYGDSYHIYIMDNGKGIPPDQLQQMNSLLIGDNPEELQSITKDKVGIYNVNARIKYHYGNAFGLRVYSTLHSDTTVKITLPAYGKQVPKL